MEIIIHARPEALSTWREQGFIKEALLTTEEAKTLEEAKDQGVASPNSNNLIEIRLPAEEISKIESRAGKLIYHRLGWRPPGPDRGDSL
ncbi:MAG: hypothetical protein NTX66_02380 [Candidatus Falkowbacteria bacterium]|nr:hypothetical protein [Candidatus Falkowbacteria bacterium]